MQFYFSLRLMFKYFAIHVFFTLVWDFTSAFLTGVKSDRLEISLCLECVNNIRNLCGDQSEFTSLHCGLLKLCYAFRAFIRCMEAAFYCTDFQKVFMCPLIKKIGRAIFYKTRGWAVEKVIRVFEGSRVNQKLQRQIEKLGCVCVLSHRPSCRNQPRYQTELVSNNVTIKNNIRTLVQGDEWV